MGREKEAQISCRITEEQARKLKIACAVKGTTIQAVLEKAVTDFVDLEVALCKE